MEENKNKYIAVAYKLYTNKDGKNTMVEEAPADKPFQFLSGFGFTLDAFEKELVNLEKGNEFDFTLTKEQAYGDYDNDHVIDLDKNIFTVNGKFDKDNIFVDAIVPLQNEDGNRFFAKVVAIGDDKVRVDLNHPLAGLELNFKGHVVESREATKDEIQSLINHMNGGGCNCDSCEGCGGHKEGEHECGCGHCH